MYFWSSVEKKSSTCCRILEAIKCDVMINIVFEYLTDVHPTFVCVADLRKQMESAELRNQRLKEVFQRKIQEFRTVCYVLTGYQMDITTENQYRLSSVYAEQMDDSLLFKKVRKLPIPHCF